MTGLIIAGCSASPGPDPAELKSVRVEAIPLSIDSAINSDTPANPVRFSPLEVLSAYRTAYPERIRRVEFRQGDWALELDGDWYYWADGRLLPEELRGEADRYDRYPFYPYSNELRPLPERDSAEAERMRQRAESREENPPRRHPGFLNALWRIYDRESSWDRMKTTYFLGHRLEIHRELLEDLAAVEEEILRRIPSDGELRLFVRELAGLDAYNWRSIAGTSSVSFHAYGAAVDILPRSYGGKQVYWRWAMQHYPDWFLLPYEKRFMPPDAFIAAFEKHGFIWGGKWSYFDTIHFEYRPEILILNGLIEY